MQNLRISADTLAKLDAKHGVSRKEVEQCFENRVGRLLTDNRAVHRTTPPTQWFLAKTNRGRTLKIVFVLRDGLIELKSAFEPNEMELEIYKRHG